MKGLRLVPEETNYNFIGLRFIAYVVSAIIMLGSVGLVATKGLNFGIDFTGGTLIEIRTPEQPNLGELRAALNDLELGAISIQEFGAPDDLLIRLPQQDVQVEASEADGSDVASAQQVAIDTVRATLDEIYADAGAVDYRRTEFVGPQVGEELKRQGALAILFSMIGILAYVWFRFEWQFGVASIVALLHDAIATIGLFALTQMEFNLSTVAAILMIAGYSINDTVIVFDRIRENLRKFKKMLLPELFNKSVNEMLSRTLMTSGTTLLALIALYVFGGAVIQGFIYALIFGIVIGTYSSVFVAAPVLLNTGLKRAVLPKSEDAADQAQEA